MKMLINFYSKEELSIQIKHSDRYPFPENETNDLFLFTCYTIRQLSNLGQHLTAKALAGLLVSKSSIKKLFEGNIKLEPGKDLFVHLKLHALSLIPDIEERIKVSLALDSQLNSNEHIMQALNREILNKVPKVIKYKGRAKRSFTVTLPPFKLNMKGFGILGRDVNHSSFHSVVALIRIFGQKFKDNEIFLDNLIEVAQHCGTAYIFNQIPPDHVTLANAILEKVINDSDLSSPQTATSSQETEVQSTQTPIMDNNPDSSPPERKNSDDFFSDYPTPD